MDPLHTKKCIPCEGGTPALTHAQAQELHAQLHTDWSLTENQKIQRAFVFKNFKEAMAFVTRVADIAEQEQHHPDIHVFYNKVMIELWTHAVSGLSENDFIVASKIDLL